jgi:hypothetical protein
MAVRGPYGYQRPAARGQEHLALEADLGGEVTCPRCGRPEHGGHCPPAPHVGPLVPPPKLADVPQVAVSEERRRIRQAVQDLTRERCCGNYVTVPICCGRPLPNGECCGQPHPMQECCGDPDHLVDVRAVLAVIDAQQEPDVPF